MAHPAEYTFQTPHVNAKIPVPVSIQFLASSALKKLKSKHASQSRIDFQKLEGLLRSIVDIQTRNEETGQEPSIGLCPGLTASPFWNADDDNLLSKMKQDLQENADLIRDEYIAANNSMGDMSTLHRSTARYTKGTVEEGTWRKLRIKGFTRFPWLLPADKNAQTLFPKTLELVKEFGPRVVAAEFLVLKPGTVLPPHTDGLNTHLACHLVVLEGGDCGLRVGEVTEDMTKDKVVFFDQSFPHSAWNHGESARVVFHLGLIHPDLTDEEVEVIHELVQALKPRVLALSPIVGMEVALQLLLSAGRRLIKKNHSPT